MPRPDKGSANWRPYGKQPKPGGPRRTGPRPQAPRPPADDARSAEAAMNSELVTAALDAFVGKHRLDKVIERRLREHREWSAQERGTFVESLHDLVRHWRLQWNRAGLKDEEHLTAINFARAKQALAASPRGEEREGAWSEAIRLSIPDWLHAVGSAELGPEWPATVAALNHPAPLFLRANALRTNAAELTALLREEAHSVAPVAGTSDALIAHTRHDIFRAKAFRDGLFEVQDIHSQQIAPMLQVEPGMRVIDACAGSGGKSLHLAALMGNKGRIVALDTAEWKLVELRRRAARAGVDNLEAREITDSRMLKRMEDSADRVLVDVPCSGLGVLRRNPDARWRLGAEELDRLRGLQATLLADYSRLVKPGGKLVYATCSILPSEGEQQVRAFLASNPGWTLEHEQRWQPDPNGGDGFYAARLGRN